MIAQLDFDRIMKVLESMRQYELMLSDFYKHCGERWEEDKSLWQNLADAEINHAENIQRMREIIEKKRDRFELGRPFNPVAINTAMAGLKDYSEKVATGAYSREKMLILARDIEKSVLESYYGEIVKTADIEYHTLMKTLLAQTLEHKKIIEGKIQEIVKKA